MRIIEDLIQGSNEWHALRAKSIGASDASVLMGNNPYKTEWQLFQEKMGLLQVHETEAMREGKRLEPIALESFCIAMDHKYVPVVCQSVERTWQIASLDGYSDSIHEILEIKCSEKLYNLAKQENIPQMYIDQIQHQLCVTGLPMAYYYAYWNGEGCFCIVKRDDEYIAKLVEKEAEFHRRMVEFQPPEPDYRHRQDQEFIDKSVLYAQRLNEQKMHENIAKEIEKASKPLRDELIAMTEGQSTIGGGLRLCKVIKKGAIDYSACPEDIDWEEYRKPPTEYWRITAE